VSQNCLSKEKREYLGKYDNLNFKVPKLDHQGTSRMTTILHFRDFPHQKTSKFQVKLFLLSSNLSDFLVIPEVELLGLLKLKTLSKLQQNVF
jgi:hypothetical protein